MKIILFTANLSLGSASEEWDFIVSDEYVCLTYTRQDSDVILMKNISTNPKYIEFIRNCESSLETMYNNGAWYMADGYAHQEKYLKELNQAMDYLATQSAKLDE